MFAWPEFSTAMLNEFRWPLTTSANLVSLHVVVTPNYRRTRERRIGEEGTRCYHRRPSLGFDIDWRNGVVICCDSATGLFTQ